MALCSCTYGVSACMFVIESLREKYRDVRRKREQRVFDADISKALSNNISQQTYPSCSLTDLERLRTKWGSFLTILRDTRGTETSFGNKIDLLEAGTETISAMIEAIDASSERVWLETYIFDSSDVARQITDALIRAKQRGCDVVVIMDYIGSLDYRWTSELEYAQIPVVLFNPFPWSNFFDPKVPKSVGPIPFRNHRKILIADAVGFCGSMNIQGETVPGEGEKFPGFYDLSARVQGPAVTHLGNVFRDSLEESQVGVTRPPIPSLPAKGTSYVQVLQSNVRKQRVAIQKALARQIREADHEVLVASSYFMPPGFLKRALLNTARSKRECKILVSGTTDFFPVPGDLMAQTHALSRFVDRPRTQVALYSHSHMHAKFTVVDSLFVQIGSYNFDRFSSRRNLECAIGVFDVDVATQVGHIHKRLSEDGFPASRDSMYFHNPLARFVCWMAYFVMKTSGRNLFDGFDTPGFRPYE